MTGSNRRPPACKAGALPAELIPRKAPITALLNQWHSTAIQLFSRRVLHAFLMTLVGLVGIEPTTPALSRRCSNRLSYRPSSVGYFYEQPIGCGCQDAFSRKEVIQPQVPLRLPCYDFTPVMNPAVVSALLAVKLPTSGRTHSHGVTGGVYKTRERIHRSMLICDY